MDFQIIERFRTNCVHLIKLIMCRFRSLFHHAIDFHVLKHYRARSNVVRMMNEKCNERWKGVFPPPRTHTQRVHNVQYLALLICKLKFCVRLVSGRPVFAAQWQFAHRQIHIWRCQTKFDVVFAPIHLLNKRDEIGTNTSTGAKRMRGIKMVHMLYVSAKTKTFPLRTDATHCSISLQIVS